MRQLHSLRPKMSTALIWAHPVSQLRDIAVGVTRDERWNPANHLYEVPRGTPPRPGLTTSGWNRRWWNPYQPTTDNTPIEFFLQPICGLVMKTSSKTIKLSGANNWSRFCPDCVRINGGARALEGQDFYWNRRRDPWLTIPAEQRPTTPDPISGL